MDTKYVVLILVLVVGAIGGVYVVGNYLPQRNELADVQPDTPPPPPPGTSGAGSPPVSAKPSPRVPQQLVLSWRYRVTTEEKLPDSDDVAKSEKTGAWVCMFVKTEAGAVARMQLPDNSFLRIKGTPNSVDGKTTFNDFSYQWDSMKRAHWLPNYEKFYPAGHEESVSHSQSSWGYEMEGSVPKPGPAAIEKDNGPKINTNAEEEPAVPIKPADKPKLPIKDDAGAAAKPEPPMAGDTRFMRSVGSWSSKEKGYSGTITLWLEIRLATDIDALK